MPDGGTLSALARRPLAPRRFRAALGLAAAAAHPAGQCAAARAAGRRPAVSRPVPERTAGGRGGGAARAGAHLCRRARRECGARRPSRTNRTWCPTLARPLLRRLTEPTPNAARQALRARTARSSPIQPRARGPGRRRRLRPLPPPRPRSPLAGWSARSTTRAVTVAARRRRAAGDGSAVRPRAARLAARREGGVAHSTAPARAARCRPISAAPTTTGCWSPSPSRCERDRQTVGIVLLTREAREVTTACSPCGSRSSALFSLALALTVLLSWYLSLTIARPILRLAGAAAAMREGKGRTGSVPAVLLRRHDEIGELAHALADSARGAVGADGRDRALRRRCGARNQEPAVVDPQRHRDAAADRGSRPAAPAARPSSPRT